MGSLVSICCVVVLLMPFQRPGDRAAQLEQAGFEAVRELRFADALTSFEKLVSLDSGRASAHYGKGLALAGLLNYGSAVEALEKATVLDPSHAEVWRRLVILYAQLQREEDTKRAYETSRRHGDVPQAEKLDVARALRRTGWPAEARALLEESGGPQSAREHLELGLIALDEEDFARAAEHLRVATADPALTTRDADYHYGRTLEILDRPEQAIEHYRRALSQDPGFLRARFRLGNLLLRSGSVEEGRALLHGYEQFRIRERRAKLMLAMISSGTLSASEERDTTLELVGLHLDTGALDDAAQLLDSAQAKYPDDADFLVARARWLFASGKRDEAAALVEPLVSAPTPHPDALWLSARVLMLQQRLPEAVARFERLLAIDPDPPAALSKELATAYALNGQIAESEALFRRSIEKDPRLAGAHAGLGSLLESTNRPEEAERSYRRALEIDPGELAAQQLLADLLVRRGVFEEAVELFRASVVLSPGNALLRRNLARALQLAGRKEEAEVELEIARQIDARQRPPLR